MLPIQYKKGWVEFYKLRFKITPDVLIPRPETELLVDEALNFIKNKQLTNQLISHELTILDIGTGSGNIAISIAKNLPAHSSLSSSSLSDRFSLRLTVEDLGVEDLTSHPSESKTVRQGLSFHLRGVNVKLIATDISEKALKVARQNARFHGVSDKITFIKGSLLSNFSQMSRSDDLTKVDVIVTNLPYIPSERIPYLDPSVKDFEPLIALDGGKDGFELYRKLFKQVKEKGWKIKLIVCEIDYTHRELAVNEAQKFFPEGNVEVKTDLAKKQRILIIRLDK